jgi:hypothetical protein
MPQKPVNKGIKLQNPGESILRVFAANLKIPDITGKFYGSITT